MERSARRAAAPEANDVSPDALVGEPRDKVAPAEVGRGYPGGGPVGLPVTNEVVETAARRLGDGIEQWAQLRAGRPAEEHPGWWCRFCPVADECPSARTDTPVEDGELDAELADGFLTDAADLGDERGD